jgi:hypothetical protein
MLVLGIERVNIGQKILQAPLPTSKIACGDKSIDRLKC